MFKQAISFIWTNFLIIADFSENIIEMIKNYKNLNFFFIHIEHLFQVEKLCIHSYLSKSEKNILSQKNSEL